MDAQKDKPTKSVLLVGLSGQLLPKGDPRPTRLLLQQSAWMPVDWRTEEASGLTACFFLTASNSREVSLYVFRP